MDRRKCFLCLKRTGPTEQNRAKVPKKRNEEALKVLVQYIAEDNANLIGRLCPELAETNLNYDWNQVKICPKCSLVADDFLKFHEQHVIIKREIRKRLQSIFFIITKSETEDKIEDCDEEETNGESSSGSSEEEVDADLSSDGKEAEVGVILSDELTSDREETPINPSLRASPPSGPSPPVDERLGLEDVVMIETENVTDENTTVAENSNLNSEDNYPQFPEGTGNLPPSELVRIFDTNLEYASHLPTTVAEPMMLVHMVESPVIDTNNTHPHLPSSNDNDTGETVAQYQHEHDDAGASYNVNEQDNNFEEKYTDEREGYFIYETNLNLQSSTNTSGGPASLENYNSINNSNDVGFVRMYQCNVCSKSFRIRFNADLHYDYIHSDSEELHNNFFKCRHCDMGSVEFCVLIRHLLSSHGLIVFSEYFPPNTTENEVCHAIQGISEFIMPDGNTCYQCLYCGQKSLTLNPIKLHVLVNHIDKVVDIIKLNRQLNGGDNFAQVNPQASFYNV